MKATVSKEERVAISHKNLAIVGFFLWMSSITQTESMYIVSYPLIMMTKSCSLISVILVGVLCSRVRNKSLKLGPKKIIVAIVVSGGIIMFRVFDPEANLESEKATELTGLGLLLLSLFADGFVPDFQAEIKEKFKPTPIEMLVSVNKWVAIFALIYLVGSWKAVDFINYCIEHTEFVWDMLIVSVLSFLGQLFVYRMIKMFRQHIVPFAIATRKIMTVGVSIVYFKHDWSWEQVVSILVVLGVMMHEFLENVGKEEEQKGGKEKDARTAVELV
jgi:UDP-galactose transporter B1